VFCRFIFENLKNIVLLYHCDQAQTQSHRNAIAQTLDCQLTPRAYRISSCLVGLRFILVEFFDNTHKPAEEFFHIPDGLFKLFVRWQAVV
jgi:hypothetical protein